MTEDRGERLFPEDTISGLGGSFGSPSARAAAAEPGRYATRGRRTVFPRLREVSAHLLSLAEVRYRVNRWPCKGPSKAECQPA
jgi:hypothetical protein